MYLAVSVDMEVSTIPGTVCWLVGWLVGHVCNSGFKVFALFLGFPADKKHSLGRLPQFFQIGVRSSVKIQ